MTNGLVRCERFRTASTRSSFREVAGLFVRVAGLDRLRIDPWWNSSRIKGNPCSMRETDRLLSKGEVATGRDARETQVLLNHKRAIEYLVDPSGETG